MAGIIISGIILIGLVALFLGTMNYQREKIEGLDKKEYPLSKLMATGLFLTDKVFKAYGTSRRGRDLLEKLRLLYGHRQGERRLQLYIAEKLVYVLIVSVIVCFFSLIIGLQSIGNTYLINGNQLLRPQYNAGDTSYELEAVLEREGEVTHKTLQVPIEEQELTLEQVNDLMEYATAYIDKAILGENTSLNYVQFPLQLIRSIPNTRLQIKWSSDSPKIIKNDGSIITEDLEESGQRVLLEATITHEEYEIDYVVPITLYPRELDLTERIEEEFRLVMNQLNEGDLTEARVTLPKTLRQGEVQIKWYEPKDNKALQTLIMGLGIALMIFFLKDEDLKRKLEERNQQLKLDFPEFISKLTLLISAGMTVNKAWGKVVADYQMQKEKQLGKQRYLYEEAVNTWHEMQGGVSELQAYETFGKHCKLPEFMKFSSLIIQNMRKGTNTLIEALREQADEAWEKRKEVAKTLGEQASTKLLFPMMLMLLVVLIIIMVPAMMSMGM